MQWRPIPWWIVAVLITHVHVIDGAGCSHFGEYSYGDMCMRLSNAKFNWSEARSDCQGHGQDLLVIRDNSKLKFVEESILGAASLYYFVGLYKDTNDYRWVNGDKVTNQYLQGKIPTIETKWLDIASKFCGVLSTSKSRRWRVQDCESKYGFICEGEATSAKTTAPTSTSTTTTTTPTSTSTTSNPTTDSPQNKTCSHDFTVQNGVMKCVCPPGWYLINEIFCYKRDVNECMRSNGGCQQKCTDILGSRKCSCRKGYRIFNETHCADVDECSTDVVPCKHECVNLPGRYRCKCFPGYDGYFGLLCVDRDECLDQNGDCSHTCTNKNGTYECSCEKGFELVNAKYCNEINCENGHNGYCDHICTTTTGSRNCSCRPGFQLFNDTTCLPQESAALIEDDFDYKLLAFAPLLILPVAFLVYYVYGRLRNQGDEEEDRRREPRNGCEEGTSKMRRRDREVGDSVKEESNGDNFTTVASTTSTSVDSKVSSTTYTSDDS